MQLYLIRHTTPDVQHGVCYGQSDIALKESFEDEWNLLHGNLSKEVSLIYSSPLKRCILLAEKIAKHLDLPIIKDERLMEINFGDWEMKRWDEIDKPSLMQWMNNYKTHRCPQGESYEDLSVRVQSFINDLKSCGHQQVVVVTHAGVIKLADSILNPVPDKESMTMKVSYGGIYQYHL